MVNWGSFWNDFKAPFESFGNSVKQTFDGIGGTLSGGAQKVYADVTSVPAFIG